MRIFPGPKSRIRREPPVNGLNLSLPNVRLKSGHCYAFLEGGNTFESAASECVNFTKIQNMTTLVSSY